MLLYHDLVNIKNEIFIQEDFIFLPCVMVKPRHQKRTKIL